MSFEITALPVQPDAETLYSDGVEKYGLMATSYVHQYAMFGRRELNMERRLFFGLMLTSFYLRIQDDDNIMGDIYTNDEIIQDGDGLGDPEIYLAE